MHAYVISLHGEEDARNRALLALLERNGITSQLIEAIDGKKIEAATYFTQTQNYLWSKQRLVTPSELGCALSHKKAYEEFLRSGESAALFFEDDVILTDRACDEIHCLARLGYQEEGYVHLGGLEGAPPAHIGIRGRLVNERPRTFKIFPYDLRLLRRTVGYLISRDIAEKCVSALNGFMQIMDDFECLTQNAGIENFYFADIVSHPPTFAVSALQDERLTLWASPAFRGNPWGVRAALARSFNVRKRRLVDAATRLFDRRLSVPVFAEGDPSSAEFRATPEKMEYSQNSFDRSVPNDLVQDE